VSHLIKIGADFKPLPAEAEEWPFVQNIHTKLIWTNFESQRVTGCRAVELMTRIGGANSAERIAATEELFGAETAARVTLEGFRLATVDELFALADRTRHSPAIDIAFFPGCKNDWYWSSTPAAFSPSDFAWVVLFAYGGAFWYGQDCNGFVRAVRAGQ